MEQMRRRPLLVSLAWWTMMTAGMVPACVHTSSPKGLSDVGKSNAPSPPPETKTGTKGSSYDKSVGPSSTLKTSGPGGIDPKEGLPLDSQLSFFRRLSRPSSPFGESDRKYILEGLPQAPQVGTVAEAALAIGLVRSVLTPPPAPAGAAAGGALAIPSLEQLCTDRQLNLATALTENPLLQRADLAAQVLKALQTGTPSPGFRESVLTALKKEVQAWSEVNLALVALEPGALTDPLGAPLTPSNAGAPAQVGAFAVEAKNFDTLLSEAQSLADRGDYQGAVKKASEIPEGHILKGKSQEKVKEYSNQAVQDLRRKAALAFQSALPVADMKTKSSYLKQAKSYLEDALKNYPDATQLPTVQDNLRVITADLEKLETNGRR